MNLLKQQLIDDIEALELLFKGFSRECAELGYSEHSEEIVMNHLMMIELSVRKLFKDEEGEN